MDQEKSKTTLKCPKCKSRDLIVEEEWRGHFIQWIQESGIIERNEGILEPGAPYRLNILCCSCDHRWGKRCAITDVCE